MQRYEKVDNKVCFFYIFLVITKIMYNFASIFLNYYVMELKKLKELRELKTIVLLLFFTLCSGTLSAQLPAVTLKTIDGQSVRTDTLNNGGKPFIIDFFATWCKPCNRELDAIAEVYDDWQQETGVKIFAISIDQAQNINKVKPLVSNHGWTYDVLLDPNGDMKRALGIQMIPFVLIVDGQGNIVYKHNGYTDGAEEELIEKVRELVKK